MAYLLFLLTFFIAASMALGQEDSLRAALKSGRENAESATTSCLLADCLRKKGDPDQTRRYAEAGLRLARKLNAPQAEAQCLHVMGNLYRHLSRYDSAKTSYERALELRRRLKDEIGVAKSLNGLGNVHKSLGNFAAAESLFQEAIGLYKKHGETAFLADAQNNLGAVYDSRGDYARAAEYYLDAMTLYRRAGNELGYASALNNLGPIYQRDGAYARAAEYYREAYEVFSRLKLPALAAHALNNRGLVLCKTQKADSARILFEHALEFSTAAKDDFGVANARFNMGVAAVQIGDYARAAEDYRLSEKMYRDLGDVEGRCHALLGIADVEQKTGRLAQALQAAKTALVEAEALQSLDLVSRANLLAAHISHDAGDHKNAYLFHVRYAQTRDSLLNHEKSRELGRLTARYEYEKAQDEARQRALEQERENQRVSELQYFGLVGIVGISFLSLFLLGRFSVSKKLANAMIFISLLLTFEFTLILFDPLIDQYSGGLPALKLGLNMASALLIMPVHAWLENLFRRKAIGGATANYKKW